MKPCNSFHAAAGVWCIRPHGHNRQKTPSGCCWSEWTRIDDGAGGIGRCEWWSTPNGMFIQHHRYAVQFPKNAVIL